MEDISTQSINERAKNDLRMGIPILLDDGMKKHLILTLDLIDEEILNIYRKIGYEILIPSVMANLLYNIQVKEPLRINPMNDVSSVSELVALFDNQGSFPISIKTRTGKENDGWIIKFVKLAELLPQIVVAEVNKKEVLNWCERNNIVTVSNIQEMVPPIKLKELSRSPLILKGAENAEIIIYKNYSKEHHAIIIGSALNQVDPIVRIHSSCYTGDLLDSLTCDCGGQLKSTIKFMSENNGGIILYLSQEGRGIGLTNKIRAYSEQILNNRDTVEANRIIGFADDERDFTLAAVMLEKLNIRKVRLVTNNPKKISQLRDNNIVVKSHIMSKIEYNRYNMHYLYTKFNKLGHIMNY